MNHNLFVTFLTKERNIAKANSAYRDDKRENFVFDHLGSMYDYDVEQDEEASEYLLKATAFETYDYVLEKILPKIEKRWKNPILKILQ